MLKKQFSLPTAVTESLKFNCSNCRFINDKSDNALCKSRVRSRTLRSNCSLLSFSNSNARSFDANARLSSSRAWRSNAIRRSRSWLILPARANANNANSTTVPISAPCSVKKVRGTTPNLFSANKNTPTKKIHQAIKNKRALLRPLRHINNPPNMAIKVLGKDNATPNCITHNSSIQGITSSKNTEISAITKWLRYNSGSWFLRSKKLLTNKKLEIKLSCTNAPVALFCSHTSLGHKN